MNFTRLHFIFEKQYESEKKRLDKKLAKQKAFENRK